MSTSLAAQLAHWMTPAERRRRIGEARMGLCMIEAKYDSGARPRAVQNVADQLRSDIALLTTST